MIQRQETSKSGSMTGSAGISAKFWQLADALLYGWDMMNELLEREWDMLKTKNIAPLWRLSREKDLLASQLKAIEKRIDLEIPCVDKGGLAAGRRWNVLLGASSSTEETARLTAFKTGLAVRKRTAFETNRRLMVWIGEQQEMNRRLAAILTGTNNDDVTYDFSGKRSGTAGNRMSGTLNAGNAGGGSTHFLAGFSQEKFNQALEAYGMAGSTAERSNPWD